MRIKKYDLGLKLLFLFFFIIQILSAQEREIILSTDELNESDIRMTNTAQESQKVLSASRTLQEVKDLPFTIYIITREEILQNSYTTLVDIMKVVPGVRVSQPGSAREGETFMMRGLVGNFYTKILINDQPIKAYGMGGFPIGAQLPIKQAERIEVIFGPAAAVYGADASAGVINIIIKETDRPTFTQADLSVGSDVFSNVDVSFGGNLGKGKRILNFSLYGSSTQFNNRRIYYDQDFLYNPQTYNFGIIDTSYIENANYNGTATNPTLGALPHLSRMIGGTLKYQNFDISAQAMYRRDHSAIGSNPLAVSYSNPLNYLGESLIAASAGYSKAYNKFSFSTRFNYLRYEIDELSSFDYVKNSLGGIVESLSTFVALSNDLPVSLVREANQQRFFNGTRFSYSLINDLNLDAILRVKTSEKVEVTGGLSLRGAFGTPSTNYMRNPYSTEKEFLPVIFSRDFGYGDFNGFIQVFLTFNRINFFGGFQYFDNSRNSSTNPRLAALYKLNEHSSLRLSFGTAFRVPSVFYKANSYFISVEDGNYLINITTDINPNGIGGNLNPEETTSFELGFRRQKNRNNSMDMALFYTESYNIVEYDYSGNINFDTTNIQLNGNYFVGYDNNRQSTIGLIGLQTQFIFRDFIPRYKVSAVLSANFFQSLSDGFGNVTADLQYHPQMILQGKLSVSPFKRIFLDFNNLFVSKHREKTAIFDPLFELTEQRFYTLDLVGRFQLNDKFQAYMKVNNVFNKKYGGLLATGGIDDLKYNPQSLRLFRFGLTYTTN